MFEPKYKQKKFKHDKLLHLYSSSIVSVFSVHKDFILESQNNYTHVLVTKYIKLMKL